MNRCAFLLLLVVVSFGVGCTRVVPAAVAPVHRPAIEQIPVDLDVVVRIDLARIRSAVDAGLAEAVGRLVAGQTRAPSGVVVEALLSTHTLWLGLRPDADPRRWDNVVILEGEFSGIPTSRLVEAFGPPRDLGGGFRAYDAPLPRARTEPARLYTYLEERWILASEAEVDALERVIERHRAERTLEPPERGLISVAAKLDRLATSLESRSQRASELAAQAVSLTGAVATKNEGFEVELRVDFLEPEDAQRAEQALRLLWLVVRVPEVEFRAESADRALTVRATLSRAALGHALRGFASEENVR